MAVWPFLMGAAAGLTIWGAYLGSWVAPLLAFLGYVCVRIVVGLDAPMKEVAISGIWLAFAFGLCYHRVWLPGVLFCLSALSYPMFVLMGARLDYMGPLAIVADVFGGLALASIFAGLLGLAGGGRFDIRGNSHQLVPLALGVEARAETAFRLDR